MRFVTCCPQFRCCGETCCHQNNFNYYHLTLFIILIHTAAFAVRYDRYFDIGYRVRMYNAVRVWLDVKYAFYLYINHLFVPYLPGVL